MSVAETYRVRAVRGSVSMVESSFGYFEVWDRKSDPERFQTYDAAAERFEEMCEVSADVYVGGVK